MVEIENEEHFLWRCIKLSDHRDLLCQAIKYNLDKDSTDFFFSLNDFDKTTCLLGAEMPAFDLNSQTLMLVNTVYFIHMMYTHRMRLLDNAI